jgi:hypothetical protein
MSESEILVRNFWKFFSDQKWNEAKSILTDDFIAEWPQSRECMRGQDNFVNVNRHYPGNHKIRVIHAHDIAPNQVVTTVWIEADTGQKTFANSYFTISEGKIQKMEEYWAEPYSAPEWRKQWVETF